MATIAGKMIFTKKTERCMEFHEKNILPSYINTIEQSLNSVAASVATAANDAMKAQVAVIKQVGQAGKQKK